jgi:phage FluMu gp28-like protein
MSVLLPYQSSWYQAKARLRVCEKARRVGITWAEAARQVLLASKSKSEGGCNCYYISTSAKLGKEYIDACTHWVRTLGLAASAMGEDLVSKDGLKVEQIDFRSGFKIQCLTSNPESMRGKGGDLIIDEAAHHQDLAELLKAAWATGDWGGSLTLISTHNGAENPFAQLCEEIRTGQRKGVLHRITIVDALKDGLYKRRCKIRGVTWTQEDEDEWLSETLATGWGSDEEYLVIPSMSGTTFLRRDLIDNCSAPAAILRLNRGEKHHLLPEPQRLTEVQNWCRTEIDPELRRIPKDKVTTVGVDFARVANGDLSVFALLTEQRDCKKTAPFLVELRGVPFKEQWKILQHICKGLGSGFGGVSIDKGGNGASLAEEAQVAFGEKQVTQVTLSNLWYSANLPKFRAAFEEGQIAVPRDVDVRDDLMMFRDPGRHPQDVRGPEQGFQGREEEARRRRDRAGTCLLPA